MLLRLLTVIVSCLKDFLFTPLTIECQRCGRAFVQDPSRKDKTCEFCVKEANSDWFSQLVTGAKFPGKET